VCGSDRAEANHCAPSHSGSSAEIELGVIVIVGPPFAGAIMIWLVSPIRPACSQQA
jgi:hypothetical protein